MALVPAEDLSEGMHAWVGAWPGVPRDRRFDTLGAALEFVSALSSVPVRIALAPGHYREKLVLDRPGVQLLGAGRDATFVEFGAHAGGDDGEGGRWGTARAATLIVSAPDFLARDLTIANTYDYDANDAEEHPQAPALALLGHSDRASLRRVRLAGRQDTLFADAGRSHYAESVIEGHVDMIFGAGCACFEDCTIVSLARPGRAPEGYVTAPSTSRHEPAGIVFHRCELARGDAVREGATFLGRPWHPTRQFGDGRYADPDACGLSAFVDCELGAHIAPEGWTSMGGWDRGGQRVMFGPETGRFGEFRSSGPGADPARPTLTAAAVARLDPAALMRDWRPPR